MLLNISNHPCQLWSAKQRETAIENWKEIKDIGFPAIAPSLSSIAVDNLAHQMALDISKDYVPEDTVLHIMGELTFCFALIRKLQLHGFTCVASTSTRQVIETQNGYKVSHFDFIAFRVYP